jgi:glucokinase
MSVTAGFDLGGTHLKYGLVDQAGSILHKDRIATPATATGLMADLRAVWTDLKARSPEPIGAAGFGFPGLYDVRARRIRQSPHCAGLDEFDLVPALAGVLDVPFIVDNDANLAALGEWTYGAGRGASSLIVMTIGTGVGAGIVLEGRIWGGARGFAGEIGHVSLNPDGLECPCGNTGCMETEVSARAIRRRYRDFSADPGDPTPEEIHRRAEAGDEAARRAFTEAGTWLGLGLSLLINVINPEKILVGGGIMAAGRLLLDPAIAEASRRSYRAAFESCSIKPTALGNDAGLIGAAAGAAREARVKTGPFKYFPAPATNDRRTAYQKDEEIS